MRYCISWQMECYLKDGSSGDVRIYKRRPQGVEMLDLLVKYVAEKVQSVCSWPLGGQMVWEGHLVSSCWSHIISFGTALLLRIVL